MGVLEDAIRQHLDLKREHGASEEELDRQESEALGASRREAEEAAAAEAEAAEAAAGRQHAEADAEDEPGAEELAEEPAAGAPAEPFDSELPKDRGAVAAEPLEEPAAEPAPPAFDDESVPAAFGDQPSAEDEPSVAAPAAAEGPVELPGEPLLEEPDESPAAEHLEPPRDFADEPDDDGEPFEFDEAEPGVAPPMPSTGEADTPSGGTGEAADGEDVLEETPEFLEETPEHDRLWFEQKPPRDFDFD